MYNYGIAVILSNLIVLLCSYNNYQWFELWRKIVQSWYENDIYIVFKALSEIQRRDMYVYKG